LGSSIRWKQKILRIFLKLFFVAVLFSLQTQKVTVKKNINLFGCGLSALGREIRELVDGNMKAGYHSVIWDGRDNAGNAVPSGIYLYQIAAGSFRDWKKLALVR
jgi:flagellar hook assembly protein FlgD